jgi:hypothetical protein
MLSTLDGCTSLARRHRELRCCQPVHHNSWPCEVFDARDKGMPVKGIDIDYPSWGTSPPKGPLLKARTGLKDHGWFILPISKQAHDECIDSVAWARRYGPHAEPCVLGLDRF